MFSVARGLKWMRHQDESTSVHCLERDKRQQREKLCNVQGSTQKHKMNAVHMKLYSTGHDLRIKCG